MLHEGWAATGICQRGVQGIVGDVFADDVSAFSDPSYMSAFSDPSYMTSPTPQHACIMRLC